MRHWLTALILAVAALGASGRAAALGETCSIIGATGLAFGNYTASAQLSSSGTFQVRCQCSGLACTGVSYRVQISAGTSGSYSPRQMALASNRLNYDLSTQSSMTPVWGSGLSGTAAPTACYILLVGGDVTTTYTVYGRAPSGQFVQAGSYSDPLTITVEYYTAVPPLSCTFP